jgi:hypothetical protein
MKSSTKEAFYYLTLNYLCGIQPIGFHDLLLRARGKAYSGAKVEGFEGLGTFARFTFDALLLGVYRSISAAEQEA